MKLFSVKLRASKDGKHISGAERITPYEKIKTVIDQLYDRLSRKEFDSINIKIDILKEQPLLVEKTLPVVNMNFKNHREANKWAIQIIQKQTGLSEEKIKQLIDLIHFGASPDRENMRGAMIVDLRGNRLEKNRSRGVRTTDVDYLDREKIIRKLKEKCFTERTADALALTTKNMLYPDIIAEYCISDEPDYLTGYVSTKEAYYRLTPLKEKGNEKGGRIYFVKNGADIDKIYRFLEEKPVLIKDVDI
ncbi:6-carboxyhexanoate--CoA ligase [Persephonella sp.]|uniref:6-carboxyhexanoate--CoA ligase n=2 Tax=Persephonella sp. TaxID=2060922 RepID=UPI0025E5E83B|nr:6-carboxyhexanoate--CoA ligase [Persephonella sp.]